MRRWDIAHPPPSSTMAEDPGTEDKDSDWSRPDTTEMAEEFDFEDTGGDGEYPANLNIASLKQINPGVWQMISEEEHLDKLESLMQRRSDHINARSGLPLRQVRGNTVLPQLEASHNTNLDSQPAMKTAASQVASQPCSKPAK